MTEEKKKKILKEQPTPRTHRLHCIIILPFSVDIRSDGKPFEYIPAFFASSVNSPKGSTPSVTGIPRSMISAHHVSFHKIVPVVSFMNVCYICLLNYVCERREKTEFIETELDERKLFNIYICKRLTAMINI